MEAYCGKEQKGDLCFECMGGHGHQPIMRSAGCQQSDFNKFCNK